ncbi:alpha/beta fold hydrolase [Cereibacter sphaeroides]|nr:alpha/beta fold hydrolase [Cereibacter sphaeroides]
MSQSPETICIEADGATLTGRYSPATGPQRATLLLNGATGVPQRFYRHFAQWANGQGIGVLTYDYRDFGESQTGPVRDSKAIFADWVIHDQAAAQAKLAELAPEGQLWVLGHSLGGLGIPFHRYDSRVTRIVTIGAGIGHYTDHPWSYRPTVLAFWFLLGPMATRLAGYMPGRRLLLGADLPAGVYWQWRRWCTSRDFYRADIGHSLPQPDYTRTTAELTLCVAADDVVVPPVAVRRYAEALKASGARFRQLDPAALGLRKLGHIEILGRGNEAAWAALFPPSEGSDHTVGAADIAQDRAVLPIA